MANDKKWSLCRPSHGTKQCIFLLLFNHVWLFIVVQSCLTFCNSMDCSMPGFPVLHHLLQFVQTHAHWIRDAIRPSHPLSPFSLSCPQSFPASVSLPVRQLFKSGSQSIGWSFSFSISPSNEYSGLISSKDWLIWSPCCPTDSQVSSPAAQLEKASVLWCSASFMVQLSHPYMTSRKTIALTIHTYVVKWCLYTV